MIDFERIQATKLKSDEVMRFADSLLALRGIDGSKLSGSRKALTRFTETRPSDSSKKFSSAATARSSNT